MLILGHKGQAEGIDVSRAIDLTGQRFGRWAVIKRAPLKNRKPYWECQCDCGRVKAVYAHSLRTGISKSCGCLKRDRARESTMEKSKNWRGGRHYHGGYVRIYTLTPEKYRENLKHTYVPEHDMVMATALGRPLRPEETVHHINGKRDDNRWENLELRASRHPCGQRVEDQVNEARQIIKLYGRGSSIGTKANG